VPKPVKDQEVHGFVNDLECPIGIYRLERKLYRELQEPRSGGAHDLAEVRVLDLPVDSGSPIELGMIEDVESLQAKLKEFGFG
jgi:hypothetical protein